MAYVNNSVVRARPVSGGLISALIAGLRETMQRRKIYKQTVKELSQLSSRELKDIAVNRGEIHSIAMDAAYGTAQR